MIIIDFGKKMITVNIPISFDTLIEAIKSLNLQEQQKLLEILENQILTAEEEWENSNEIMAEVQSAKEAYQAGDYKTLEEFLTN